MRSGGGEGGVVTTNKSAGRGNDISRAKRQMEGKKKRKVESLGSRKRVENEIWAAKSSGNTHSHPPCKRTFIYFVKRDRI